MYNLLWEIKAAVRVKIEFVYASLSEGTLKTNILIWTLQMSLGPSFHEQGPHHQMDLKEVYCWVDSGEGWTGGKGHLAVELLCEEV